MKAIICDTHLEDIEKYKILLNGIATLNKVELSIQTFSTIPKLLFELEDIGSQIDLIYIENDFSETDLGKNAVLNIRKLNCRAEIIFLTNRTDKWPDGYDVGAFHYLSKKDTKEKFCEVFTCVMDKIIHKDRRMMSFVYAGDRISVEINQIRYFESQGRIITVHYDDQKFEFYSRMEKLENTLLPEGFIRVHRSFLVNRTYIEDYRNGVLITKNGSIIPVNRKMQPLIKNIVLA